MSIGVLACKIMKRELDKVMEKRDDITEVIYIDACDHMYPQKLKEALVEQINSLKDRVDVIFLGYGYCQSLYRIDEQFDIPIVHPQERDCIAILLTPERYAKEVEKEASTWFMTPGWAEQGIDLIFNKLHINKARDYGVDHMEVAKEIFNGCQRGLLIDTGVGDMDYFTEKAKESCDAFGISLEVTDSSSTILEQHLDMCSQLDQEIRLANDTE